MSDVTFLITVLTLSALLIGSNVYWMIHTQKLVNKVMSNNYRDYAVGVAKESPQPRPPKVQETSPEDLRALQEFSFN